MMIGASGVGRSLLRSDGTLSTSPSSSVRKLSWPSSLCMGCTVGEAGEVSCRSVRQENQRLGKKKSLTMFEKHAKNLFQAIIRNQNFTV